MNSQLGDLGSAISVITKEPMTDFTMFNMNEALFNATGTEGTGTYTQFGESAGGGRHQRRYHRRPSGAHHIRGLGNGNVSNGNFETSKRVPLDSIDSAGVKISRGLNAVVLGLGNPPPPSTSSERPPTSDDIGRRLFSAATASPVSALVSN